jgi:hypothetical protein
MEKDEAVLADLEQLRESAAARIRAKLDAVTAQIRELSSRAVGDLSAVIPPDLETLLPITTIAERVKELAKPPAPAETAPAPELFEIEETPAAAHPEFTPSVADASATVHLKVPVAPAPMVAPPTPPPAAPARSPEEERKHEEARRFARLLVSEIRLYNEQAVQTGKIARDIYQRLKDDIDRSREMYEQRVSLDVRSNSNYFFDELVRILADGEPDALGM